MSGLSIELLVLGFSGTLLIFVLNRSSLCQVSQRRGTSDAALFIFGDSLFDAGNNNYIDTVDDFRSNFWPYGKTFFKFPTGRFSDGRIIPDFIAEYAKLPFILPYLQPGNNFEYGVNFASSGAGVLVETHQGLVIDLQTQLDYFKNVSNVLRQRLGDVEAETLLSRAVYLISIGTNDYLTPFFSNSTMFGLHTREEFVDMVISNLTTVIKGIYEEGGRKFGFVSLWPLAEMPGLQELALSSRGSSVWLEEANALAKLHNKELSTVLKRLSAQLKGFKYSNADFYPAVYYRIINPSEYGFKEVKEAYCGSFEDRGNNGKCGGKGKVKGFKLCQNCSEYLFLDSVHPTEAANKQFAALMWSGDSSFASPYNLRALFS